MDPDLSIGTRVLGLGSMDTSTSIDTPIRALRLSCPRAKFVIQVPISSHVYKIIFDFVRIKLFYWI